MVKSGFIGIDSSNCLHFTELCVAMVFCKKCLLLLSFFGTPGFMGIIFRKFSAIMGILSRNFSGFLGGISTVWMAQPHIMETQVPARVHCRFDFQTFWNCSYVCACIRSFESGSHAGFYCISANHEKVAAAGQAELVNSVLFSICFEWACQDF